jgi:hypothetical protein
MKPNTTKILNLTSWALAFALIATPAAAHAKDVSVERRLDENRMKYEIDKDGDYKVTISFGREKRSQMIFVTGVTEALGGMNIRKIFSPAATIATDGVDGAKALELMRDSRVKKLGSWEIEGANLYLVVKVPETLTAAQLQSVMMATASLADDMEIKLSGKRDAL